MPQVDGFTIVIELREGRTYRKSVIYSSIPATSDADWRARIIYNAVDRALPYRTPTAPP